MILSGYVCLGRDAELRYTPSNVAVCNLALAYSYGQKDTDGKKSTQWVDAILWGKQAEALQQYLLKGTKLAVVINDVHEESYTTQAGETRTKLVGRLIDLDFIGSGQGQQGQQQSQPQPSQPQQRPAETRQPAANLPYEDYDDDIPF